MNAFAKVDKEAFYRFAAEHAEQRYEYVRGRIVQQMIGGTKRHGIVAGRLKRVIEDQLDPSRWSAIGDRGVDTATSIRYPDVVVEPAVEPGDSLSTRRPVLIAEVLSPSTSAADLDEKRSSISRSLRWRPTSWSARASRQCGSGSKSATARSRRGRKRSRAGAQSSR